MQPAELQKIIGKVVTQFAAAIQNSNIYPDDHPLVRYYIQETHRLLAELLAEKSEVTVLMIGDSLVVDKRSMIVAGAFEKAFIDIMRDHSIERLTFTRGLTVAEIEEFIKSLLLTGASKVHPLPHIKAGKLEVKDEEELDRPQRDDELEDSRIVDMGLQTTEDRIRNIFKNASGRERIALEDPDEIVRAFMDNIGRESNPLRLLAETKSNDEYTFTHTANVGILTLFFAEQLGFKGSYLNRIGVAAVLHDVGKVTTPDAILSKKGPLTVAEREVMETHALKGALSLMEQTNITRLAVLVAMEHHMKYDGTGYPKIKGGGGQHIVSQMVSIADVYDALRTIRPYRPEPMPMDRIIQIFVNGSGTAFNPYLVQRFLDLVAR